MPIQADMRLTHPGIRRRIKRCLLINHVITFTGIQQETALSPRKKYYYQIALQQSTNELLHYRKTSKYTFPGYSIIAE